MTKRMRKRKKRKGSGERFLLGPVGWWVPGSPLMGKVMQEPRAPPCHLNTLVHSLSSLIVPSEAVVRGPMTGRATPYCQFVCMWKSAPLLAAACPVHPTHSTALYQGYNTRVVPYLMRDEPPFSGRQDEKTQSLSSDTKYCRGKIDYTLTVLNLIIFLRTMRNINSVILRNRLFRIIDQNRRVKKKKWNIQLMAEECTSLTPCQDVVPKLLVLEGHRNIFDIYSLMQTVVEQYLKTLQILAIVYFRIF